MAQQVKVILFTALVMMLLRPTAAEVIALAAGGCLVRLLVIDALQQRRLRGYVYVLAGSMNGNVKIGITNNLERRLRCRPLTTSMRSRRATRRAASGCCTGRWPASECIRTGSGSPSRRNKNGHCGG